MTEKKSPIISFKNFSFQYRAQKKPTLKEINLDIYPGERVLIAGPSGCGKSTLVRLMNGLLQLQDGNLSVNGINAGNPANKWELCRICGMVFQNPDNQIIGTSVEEDVAFGPENKNIEPEKIRKIVEIERLYGELYNGGCKNPVGAYAENIGNIYKIYTMRVSKDKLRKNVFEIDEFDIEKIKIEFMTKG